MNAQAALSRIEATGTPGNPSTTLAAACVASRLNAATCLECGAGFDRVGTHGAFCGTRCRTAWNNRRLARGAELYDLFMAIRFDRPRAKSLKLWTALSRAAALFRHADLDERAGRRSWSEPTEILARRPYLRTSTVLRRKAAP